METNVLYYGDNLEILRKYIPNNSIDLIYLDPPFNSKATYNVLFREPSGESSQAQIAAFEDTWHWNLDSELALREIAGSQIASSEVKELMSILPSLVGKRTDMMAYLTMMCIRLIELKRVLKDTGSIYLHCDPNASHYLKILMDTVFGASSFKNEIVWHYSGWNKKLKSNFESRHDILLFYSKSASSVFNSYAIPWDSVEDYVQKRKQKICNDEDNRPYVLSDAGGGKRVKRYLDDALQYGIPVDDVWDLDKVNNSSKERLGYPTQKPEALLERIVKANSNEGDLILDPFCGCGTAVVVAERLKRKWIGIDITHLAIALMKWRLKNLSPQPEYTVIGEPKDISGAIELAYQNKYQFQWWAISVVGGQPYGDKKKGADSGIDGYLYYMDEKDKIKKAIISVKGGKNINVGMIRDLGHVIEREKSDIGIFLTIEKPSKPMLEEAALIGLYHSPNGKDYPRLQILTIEAILQGKMPNIPPWIAPITAPSQKKKPGKTAKLL